MKIVISSDWHEIARALEPRVRRRPGPPRLARAGSDPEHAPLGRGQEAAQEVKYRAVIFDLWQTLVPWDLEESKRFTTDGGRRRSASSPSGSGRCGSRAAPADRNTGPIERPPARALCRARRRAGHRPRPGDAARAGEAGARPAARRAPDARRAASARPPARDDQRLHARTFRRSGTRRRSAGKFDATVFSCDVGVSKPDPRIYEIACEQLEVEPADCLFVGDGANDELPGAERAGMTAVQLRAPGEAAHGRRRSVAGRGDRAPGRGRRTDRVTVCYESQRRASRVEELGGRVDDDVRGRSRARSGASSEETATRIAELEPVEATEGVEVGRVVARIERALQTRFVEQLR